jgi:hypothetical protein
MSKPSFVPPMLAKLVRTLPEGPEWEYELKLDGYRLEAIKDGDEVRLYSRRGNDFTKKLATIARRFQGSKKPLLCSTARPLQLTNKERPSFQNAAKSQLGACRLVACLLCFRPVALERKKFEIPSLESKKSSGVLIASLISKAFNEKRQPC